MPGNMNVTGPNSNRERVILDMALHRHRCGESDGLVKCMGSGNCVPLGRCRAGGLIGWYTSAYFARLSAKDTEAQLALARQQLQVAERQSRMLVTLLTVAEEGGKMKLARDEKGEITGGRIIELAADAASVSRASADLTTNPKIF